MPAGTSAPPVNKNMSPPQFPAMPSTDGNVVGSLSQATNPPAIASLGHGQQSGQMGNVGSKLDMLDLDRPGSSSSTLADAFGSPHQQHQQEHHYLAQHDHYRMHQQHTQSSESPRESSVGAESDSGVSASYRPSFKRLASQTLGPVNAKRALLGPAGWDDVRRDSSEDIEEDEELQEDDKSSRPSAGRAYRDSSRRFSLPGTTAGATMLPPLKTVAQDHDQHLQ